MCFVFLYKRCNLLTYMKFQVAFHGIKVNQEEILLDGSEGPVRIEAEALLASEKLAPVAILNKVKLVMFSNYLVHMYSFVNIFPFTFLCFFHMLTCSVQCDKPYNFECSVKSSISANRCKNQCTFNRP